jgi:NADPH:quinone reductase-like Zn-dependent oxidoreductase
LGHECAGTVIAVGDGVSNLAIGDDVIAIARDSLGTFAVAEAALTIRMPKGLSFAKGATLPIAYATAIYALQHLAKLKAGDRVLIHAAAGGVGLAAVRLCLSLGAEVFATAGSPAKHDFLHMLGVQHIYDSRSLDFAVQILADTNGAGVDVVLNSLTGDAIACSFDALAPGGRFLEIGKRGVWDAGQVAALGKDIDYHVIYLGEVTERDPHLVAGILREVVDAVEAGVLSPLPLRSFTLADATNAFRYMAQARHIGKVVLTPEVESTPASIQPDGTYLITGGLGGIGLTVARWLVEQGARHIVLVGRHAPSASAVQAIQAMRALGTQVTVEQADVARADEIAAVLAHIDRSMPALRGVFHAAGVLDDGLLAQQSWERFERVLGPKVNGAWNLHVLTQDKPLDLFVLFSAGAALIGPLGQGSYAAANAFLDGLAYLRASLGLPAISINWGACGYGRGDERT